jgi:hypothetical protein
MIAFTVEALKLLKDVIKGDAKLWGKANIASGSSAPV